MRLLRLALVTILLSAWGLSQTLTPTAPESPGWVLQPPPDRGGAGGRGARGGGGRGGDGGYGGRGMASLPECAEDVVNYCAGKSGYYARECLVQNSAQLSPACKDQVDLPPNAAGDVRPSCEGSPICASRVAGGGSGAKGRVVWEQTMGYTYSYPYADLPEGGGVSAVDLDSKGNLWAFQRNAVGKPQLFKFGPDHKLLLAIGDDVITHQIKAHGIKVDAEDNVWICDTDGATIKKLNPEGKLLATIGVRGKRGDWDEAKGQRLLWQPVHIDFASNGDIYIFEGHANESPNDTDSGDPGNNLGIARVIHLDENMNYINQWYGNSGGPGKFYQTHGSAVDPTTGEVWIGDREEYRIVVYDANGKFIRTIQTRNLVCALYFEKNGQLWLASGQDGQFLKVDRDANVLGAVGRGSGREEGQFIEASYFAIDQQGNLYTGDTSVGRITLMRAPNN